MNDSNKPIFLIFAVLLGMAVLVLYSRSRAGAGGGSDPIPWRPDLSAAQSESRQTGKPVFAYFTADWCGPCQSLKRTTWPDQKVGATLTQFVPVKIDIDDHRDIAMRYQIQSIPTFAVLDNDGNIRAQVSGALGPNELVGWLAGR